MFIKPSGEPRWLRIFFVGILGILIAVGIFLTPYTVPAGRVGVITRFGAVNRVAYPGLGFKIPYVEGVQKMDVRTVKNQVDASAASKDLQEVTSIIAVNYHLDGKYATNVFQEVGMEYDEVVVDPAVQNTFKDVTAKFTAEELITKRQQVGEMAQNQLAAEMEKYHVVIENFNIVNFDFSPEYNDAIEKKQVAQQEVETAKQLLNKTKIEAEIAVTKAQGEADAQATLKNTGALTSEYLQYLFLQNWDGTLPQVMGGATPIFNVQDYLGGTIP